MDAEVWNAIAAIAAAVAACFAAWVAHVSLAEARRNAQEAARREAISVEAQLQSRLDPLYDGLRAVLGTIDDGVPLEVRRVLIPFFVLYADAFAAYRDGVLPDDAWNGFGTELANWAQREPARRAWQVFRRQEWTDGFVEHVDGVLAGAPAYPRMSDISLIEPTVRWPRPS
jgi:hypothetical protein